MVFCAVALYGANEVVLEVGWDTFNRNQYQGVLVLPENEEGVSEFVDGFKGRSSDGHVVGGSDKGFGFSSMNNLLWKIKNPREGIYKLYLFPSVNDAPNKQVWSRDVTVSVSADEQTQRVSPRKQRGNVWYVLSYNGATGEVLEKQEFFPVRKMIFGWVRDSLTGEALSEVKVQLYELESGKPVEGQAMMTDGDGFYLLHSFPLGHYTLGFEKEKYIGAESGADFMLRNLPVRISPLLSPVLKDTSFRVCLDWGEYPLDLDAHLLGPGENGNSFHISYNNMTVYNDRHFLDIDDKESFGPETITIGGLDPGTYRFLVHDFTNRRKKSDAWNLAESEAVVTLYRGSRQLGQFRIPQQAGTLWEVFRIDGATGKITPVDGFEYVEEP